MQYMLLLFFSLQDKTQNRDVFITTPGSSGDGRIQCILQAFGLLLLFHIITIVSYNYTCIFCA